MYLSDQELAALRRPSNKPASPRLTACLHIFSGPWQRAPGELIADGRGNIISLPAWGQYRRPCIHCGKAWQYGRGNEYGKNIQVVE